MKKEYDEFIKTEEGQKALAEKKEDKAGKKDMKVKRAVKAAVKSVEKDDKLKKPMSSYWMWLGDHRQEIMDQLKKDGKGVGAPEVGTRAGQIWKNMSAEDKLPYETKAKKAKADHDAFLKTDEGATLMKEHKEAVSAASSEVKGQPPPEPKKSPTKRKVAGTTEVDQSKPSADQPKPSPEKKPRAKKAAKAVETEKKSLLDDAVLAEADTLGYKTTVQNLAARPEVAVKEFSGKQILDALKTSNGLVNKAKQILLAGA